MNSWLRGVVMAWLRDAVRKLRPNAEHQLRCPRKLGWDEPLLDGQRKALPVQMFGVVVTWLRGVVMAWLRDGVRILRPNAEHQLRCPHKLGWDEPLLDGQRQALPVQMVGVVVTWLRGAVVAWLRGGVVAKIVWNAGFIRLVRRIYPVTLTYKETYSHNNPFPKPSPSFPANSLFTIHYSLFTNHYSLFTNH